MSLDIPLSNNDARHREALVEALGSAGLGAYVLHSGGGNYHVVLWISTRPETTSSTLPQGLC